MRIVIFYLLIIFMSCTESNSSKKDNANSYKNIKDSILFLNKDSDVFIIHETYLISRTNNNDLVYRYFNEASLNDSVVELRKIIDTSTFRKLNDTIYTDTNYQYIFNYSPNRYPSFKAIVKKK